MPRRVYVTHAQKRAAQAMVARYESTGREVSDAMRKIAEAKIEFVDATSTSSDHDPRGVK